MKIVKVQQSLATNASNRQMLFYDQTRGVRYETDLTPEVERLLAGRPKAYFFYTMDAQNEMVLGQEAPAQSW